MDSSSSSSKMCIVYLPSSFFSPPNPINAPLVPEWLRGEDIESNGGPFVAHIQKQRCMAYYFWFGLWRALWLYWSTFRNLHHFQENTSDSTYPIPDTHVGGNARVALYAQNLFVSTFIKKRKMARKPFKFSRIARIYELIWQNQIFRMQHETCASGRLNISVSGNKVANKNNTL